VLLVDVLFSNSPVAMQLFDATQDTAKSSSSTDPGLALVLMDQNCAPIS